MADPTPHVVVLGDREHFLDGMPVKALDRHGTGHGGTIRPSSRVAIF